MKIIDSHNHLGDCRVFGCNVTEADLIGAMDRNGVTATVTQPYPGASDEADVHKRIYDLAKKYPGRIYGLASVNPHTMDKAAYFNKMQGYIEGYGFKAIKLHTIGHAVHPQSEDGKTVIETAVKLGVPLNVHTGPGVPFSLPSLLFPAAKQYPDLKIVLAHSGAGLFAGEAIALAQQCPNVYLELSWCSVEDATAAIQSIGSERVMFGSDSNMNIPTALAVFAALPLSDKQREDALWRTAQTVFAL